MPVEALEGAAELDRKIKALPPKVALKIGRSALRKAGKMVLAATRAAAPVRTGYMKKALKLYGARRSRRHQIGVNIGFDTKKHPKLVSMSKAGKRHFYPAVLEYGTATRQAHAFMRPAWDATKRQALKTLMVELGKGLEKAARGKA